MSTQVVESIERLQGNWETWKQAQTKRADDLERRMNHLTLNGVVPPADSEPAAVTPEFRQAFRHWCRSGDNSALVELDPSYRGLQEINPTRSAGMSVDQDPGGGVLVEPFLGPRIMATMEDISNLRTVCRVVPISTGDAYKEVEDRGDDAGATWVGERESRPETSAPPLGTKEFPIHEIYAAPQMTQKLLDDANFTPAEWLSDKVGESFGKSESLAFVTGSGSKQPRGFLTYDTVTTDDDTRDWGDVQYVPTGVAGGFHATLPGDALHDCVSKLATPYRRRATWLMNRETAGAVRKLKDGDGRYLWERSFQAGDPDLLLGYPTVLVDEMPAIAANSLSVAFGDWRKAYCIVDRVGIRILRDPFTAKPHVVFYTMKRVGGDVSDFRALKFVKFATS